jgi:hypothetical protein
MRRLSVPRLAGQAQDVGRHQAGLLLSQDRQLRRHLVLPALGNGLRITDISYFSDSGISYFEPFFYQALTEIGYYGYRFDIFGDLLQYVSDSELPDFAFSAPEGVSLDYDYSVAENVDNYIRDASNFIFIYGMKDTWSATSVTLSGQSNSLKIMKKEGDHSTRIGNLDPVDRELVLGTLNDWLVQ